MPNSMLWTRIMVLSDITAWRTDNSIATHHHDHTLVRGIRQNLLEDLSSIFHMEHVIGRPKVTNPELIA
jgi:hypothetical protein